MSAPPPVRGRCHRASREPRHRRVEVRRGGDHRLVGDADRGRPQRRRLHQPAAADVGPPRSRSGRPTSSIPFGYGRELYFWSFVVAVLVFALGAGVSIYEGIIHIANPEQAVSPIIAYVVLLVAFLLEGWSTLEAFKEFKRGQGRARLVRRRSGGRRTRPRSSSCSKMARPWPASSPRRSAWRCRS